MGRRSRVEDELVVDKVCELWAYGMNYSEVAREVSRSMQEGIDWKCVKRIVMKADNYGKVEKWKQKRLSNPMGVEIAQKRVRLEDLDRERVRIGRIIAGMGEIAGEKKLMKYLSVVKRLIELLIAGREEVERRSEVMDMIRNMGALTDITDEELVEYDRKLTIELTERVRGGEVRGVIEAEVGGREGVKVEVREEPAKVLLAS